MAQYRAKQKRAQEEIDEQMHSLGFNPQPYAMIRGKDLIRQSKEYKEQAIEAEKIGNHRKAAELIKKFEEVNEQIEIQKMVYPKMFAGIYEYFKSQKADGSLTKVKAEQM